MSRAPALNNRWQKLCADIADEARRRGATDPQIFACESGLCVMDGPPFDDQEMARSDKILFTLPWPSHKVMPCGSGGW